MIQSLQNRKVFYGWEHNKKVTEGGILIRWYVPAFSSVRGQIIEWLHAAPVDRAVKKRWRAHRKRNRQDDSQA